jgi:hypothetical protein
MLEFVACNFASARVSVRWVGRKIIYLFKILSKVLQVSNYLGAPRVCETACFNNTSRTLTEVFIMKLTREPVLGGILQLPSISFPFGVLCTELGCILTAASTEHW